MWSVIEAGRYRVMIRYTQGSSQYKFVTERMRRKSDRIPRTSTTVSQASRVDQQLRIVPRSISRRATPTGGSGRIMALNGLRWVQKQPSVDLVSVMGRIQEAWLLNVSELLQIIFLKLVKPKQERKHYGLL